MKRLMASVARMIVALVAIFGVTLLPVQNAMAAEEKPEMSILTQCRDADDTVDGGGVFCVLNIVLDILTYGVGIAGTLGIIISGIQYLTARDNEQQLVKAKSRLFNIVIGLALYATMFALLKFLLPGGVFGR